MTADDMPWRRQAACIATGPATFYPERDGNDVVADIVRAKVICASCPVQADCLQHALDQLEQYGIWGGMTWEERRSLRRKRRREERAAVPPAAPRSKTKRAGVMVHGRRGTYTAGCRCKKCTEANRLDMADLVARYHQQEKDPNDPRHGTTNFYQNYGCRCSRCLAANRAKYARRKAS